jgi:hypothetical protein
MRVVFYSLSVGLDFERFGIGVSRMRQHIGGILMRWRLIVCKVGHYADRLLSYCIWREAAFLAY